MGGRHFCSAFSTQKRTDCKTASRQLAEHFAWSKNIAPKEFAMAPHHLPAFTVSRCSLLERAHAVYSRGGKEMVIQRSKELFWQPAPVMQLQRRA